jgi:hypothetical protein
VSSGDVVGQAWEMYKAHWRHLLPIAFVVYLLIALLALLLALLLGWVGIIIGGLVSLAGIFWLQGALVVAIQDVRDGRADLSIGETLSRVRPHLNTLTVAGILAAIGIALGFLLLIVPGLLLLTWWLLIVPVIMLERAGVMESFGRSRELVQGYGWSVFGVIVLTVLILIGVSLVFGILAAIFDNEFAKLVLDVISQTLTAPFIALAWTLTYYALLDANVQAQPAAGGAAEFPT